MEVSQEDKTMSYGCAMRIPPNYTTLRLNGKNRTLADAMSDLTAHIDSRSYRVEAHPEIDNLIIITPTSMEPGTSKQPRIVPNEKEIYVDAKCGASVMRGAHVFAAGLLASSNEYMAGDSVSLWMCLGKKPPRGTFRRLPAEVKVFLGNGLVHVSRKHAMAQNFRSLQGMGVEFTERIRSLPPLDDQLLIPMGLFLQNLPSALAAQVLQPSKGSRVLDMCSAPGGKTLALASLMEDQGEIIALDSSESRLNLVKQNAQVFGFQSIRAYHVDGRKCIGSIPGVDRESFDYILLDAPCSSLGQRPAKIDAIKNQNNNCFPKLQKKLFDTAVALLKPGGYLVYSTCTVQEDENEAVVTHALNEHADMVQLVPQIPVIGSASTSSLLSSDHRQLVQLFDPRTFCKLHAADKSCLTCDESPGLYEGTSGSGLPERNDTIGFFIAKFRRQLL